MYGIAQPITGMTPLVHSPVMPRLPKGPAPEELLVLRAVLASNLRAFIVAEYGSKMSETAAAETIGKATKLGKNTVLRALGSTSDDVDLRLDTLVRLARHFNATALDLLRDYGKPAAIRRDHSRTKTARAEGMDTEKRAALQRRRSA